MPRVCVNQQCVLVVALVRKVLAHRVVCPMHDEHSSDGVEPRIGQEGAAGRYQHLDHGEGHILPLAGRCTERRARGAHPQQRLGPR
jgi:hypothetical protein